jgi:hypothetical protein
MWWIIIIIGGIVGAVFCFSIGYILLLRSAKKEVVTAPKIPMYLCDIHGAFPAKHCMQIEVPVVDETQRPLVVDMCPFCYDEKMKVAEKVFKS